MYKHPNEYEDIEALKTENQNLKEEIKELKLNNHILLEKINSLLREIENNSTDEHQTKISKHQKEDFNCFQQQNMYHTNYNTKKTSQTHFNNKETCQTTPNFSRNKLIINRKHLVNASSFNWKGVIYELRKQNPAFVQISCSSTDSGSLENLFHYDKTGWCSKNRERSLD